MEDFLPFVRDFCAEIDESRLQVPFAALGVDSFELLSLRLALERRLGRKIPDPIWTGLRNFDQLRLWLERRDDPLANADPGDRGTIQLSRDIEINMPHMAVGGLSEQWLFKELGAAHWSLVCEALQRPSHDIQDHAGHRLYATFVRFRWTSNTHLKQFRENDRLRLRAALTRHGASFFFSEASLESDGRQIRADLMTTFAARAAETNRELVKGEPPIPENCRAIHLPQLPMFSEEYRQMRKGALPRVTLGQDVIPVAAAAPLYERDYTLNPYADLNGVNLLYFAAYPMIADICEREFIHQHRPDLFTGDWALEAATEARDVFYLANCDLHDPLVFAVDWAEPIAGRRFATSASLRRKRDRALLANLFTIKRCHG